MASKGTAREWTPSRLGTALTRSPDWHLRLEGTELTLVTPNQTLRVNVETPNSFRVHRGALWTDVTLNAGSRGEVKVDGLPNGEGDSLSHALERALAEKRLGDTIAFVQQQHQKIDYWLDLKDNRERLCQRDARWLTHEQQEALLAERQGVNADAVQKHLKSEALRKRYGSASVTALQNALARWNSDHQQGWKELNSKHVERELVECRDLLNTVESKPLTEEQARAVLCFDNRVQLVASAGSGKTSTMVAKAAYAIHRNIVPADRIVMLAFNKAAAKELKERAQRSFERLGMPHVKVEARTFHSMGRAIIGEATGTMPDVPNWAIDPKAGAEKLGELIDGLKDASDSFRSRWDLFRFVFGKDLAPRGDKTVADSWDADGRGLVRTAHGETVRSQEEAMIANWLFYNGVDYRYEQAYEHPTANSKHRQYRPDFYYPDLGLYHEHFAFDEHGNPPKEFEGYAEEAQWKRSKHREMNTALFETTSHGLRKGNDLKRLEAELTQRGIVLDPNPDRPIPRDGQMPMQNHELIGLVRTFISHAKSNGLKHGTLLQRLDALPSTAFKYRHMMFLDLVDPIMKAWDDALDKEGGIDFEDMLVMASRYLEQEGHDAGYDLVMADEFQDASLARARLCRALVQKPGRFFFAVGDDWQSINRFAGADVSVMTGFIRWFGHGQTLRLERTFRCPQALCDVSSRFVSKNPEQIKKRVVSDTPEHGPVLTAIQMDTKDELGEAVARHIRTLAEDVRSNKVAAGRNGKVSVFVLGRYRADKCYVPKLSVEERRFVEVSFLTAHSSKGSEADYVVLPEMLSVSRGRSFPSTRDDDPVLALAMPQGDTYPLAEERRLFYVALTRARRSVAMFTVRGRQSSFLRELVEEKAVTIATGDGQDVKEHSCPACKQGVLLTRSSDYGQFVGCSNFPDCRYKVNSPTSTKVTSKRSGAGRRAAAGHR